MAYHLVNTAGDYEGQLREVLQARLGNLPGPEPLLDAHRLLVVLLIHALMGRDMILTKIVQHINAGLPQRNRDEILGTDGRGQPRTVTHRQVAHPLTRLIAAFAAPPHDHPQHDPDGAAHPCAPECGGRRNLDWIMNKIVAASVATDLPLSPHTALDSTDAETWAVRRSWGSTADVTPDSLEAVEQGLDLNRRHTARVGGRNRTVTTPQQRSDVQQAWAETPRAPREPRSRKPVPTGPHVTGEGINHLRSDYPQLADDGRLRHTASPQAREGFRSGRNGRRSETFIGDDLHLLVAAPSSHDPNPTVRQILSITWSPAGSHKGDAGVRTIEHASGSGFTGSSQKTV